MNAYELADQLEERHAPYEDDAANMLRQQADRIDKLEREAIAKNNYLERHCEKIDQQADRIAELENEVKRLVGAEPITYGMLTFCKNCGQQDPYTQTKPLSDEEVIKIRQTTKAKSTENWADTLAFARAIEERHGIK